MTSSVKTASPHATASHKKIQAGENVLVDICGVCRCYHTNLARTFSMSEPHPKVAETVRRSSGLFARLPEIVRPGIPVSDLTDFARDYYREHGLWENRGWVGGYELGIAMPPDWDGAFVYGTDLDNGYATLDPGMVINLKSDVYLLQKAGSSLTINTLAFGQASVDVLTHCPNELTIIA